MEQITYKLEVFEGPLDLLLSLIAKNKIDMSDIPISLLCDQYMDYITKAEELDMELSSDFLYMASELMLIKSRMLLPRNNEEEEDPREALAAALLEYQRAKQASGILRERFNEYGARMAKETDEITPDKSYVADHKSELLYKAFMKVMNEVKVTDTEAKKKFEPILKKRTVSVVSIVENLARRLRGGRKVSLGSFFRSAEDRLELVSMFLAMLELLKSGHLILEESAKEDENGVIDATSDVAVSLDPGADIAELTKIVDHN
ncbi:MAG: segregation/condensation protein A [Ruminococcaceae bacterium]|nr:segregation/condensation protein A [Oscillospiraceae bacterium]